ncbi:hypothetical protein [Deinococcus sp. PEB2-63]
MDTSALPADVQAQVNAFWTAFLSASGAYQTLSTGYPSIWAAEQYPLAYRGAKAAEFMDAVFIKQKADLDAAHAALDAARAAVVAGLTPPLLGDTTTHELKLLNARETVRQALDGLDNMQRLDTLHELFKEARRTGHAGLATFIGGTLDCAYFIRDAATRMLFQEAQADMLKELLPPTSAAYFQAGAVLDRLTELLDLADATRHFTAKDNGLELFA